MLCRWSGMFQKNLVALNAFWCCRPQAGLHHSSIEMLHLAPEVNLPRALVNHDMP